MDLMHEHEIFQWLLSSGTTLYCPCYCNHRQISSSCIKISSSCIRCMFSVHSIFSSSFLCLWFRNGWNSLGEWNTLRSELSCTLPISVTGDTVKRAVHNVFLSARFEAMTTRNIVSDVLQSCSTKCLPQSYVYAKFSLEHFLHIEILLFSYSPPRSILFFLYR